MLGKDKQHYLIEEHTVSATTSREMHGCLMAQLTGSNQIQ